MYSQNQTITIINLITTVVFLTLSLTARAVSPPPDGGYLNQNTAEGDDALFNLAGGVNNYIGSSAPPLLLRLLQEPAQRWVPALHVRGACHRL